MKKRNDLVYVLCEHEPEHKNYDPSLLRKCKGTSLIECTKCYTLEDER